MSADMKRKASMKRKVKKIEKRRQMSFSGELHMARNGAGYLINPGTDAAIWVEAKDLGTALPGDTVTVLLGRDGTADRPHREARGALDSGHRDGGRSVRARAAAKPHVSAGVPGAGHAWRGCGRPCGDAPCALGEPAPGAGGDRDGRDRPGGQPIA